MKRILLALLTITLILLVSCACADTVTGIKKFTDIYSGESPQPVKYYQWTLDTETGSLTVGEYYPQGENPTSTDWRATAYKDLIRDLYIEDGMDTIFPLFFNGLTNLQTVSLPRSMTTIYQQAFKNCTSLTAVTFRDYNSLYNPDLTIGNEAFLGCTSLHNFLIPDMWAVSNGMDFPDTVVSIGQSAFKNCTAIEVVNLPIGDMLSLENYIFSGCSELKVVTAYGIQNIGTGCFSNCSKLWSLGLNDNLKTIGSSAFSGCSALTGTLTLPAGVTSVGTSAFSGAGTADFVLELPEGISEIPRDTVAKFKGTVVVRNRQAQIAYQTQFAGVMKGYQGSTTETWAVGQSAKTDYIDAAYPTRAVGRTKDGYNPTYMWRLDTNGTLTVWQGTDNSSWSGYDTDLSWETYRREIKQIVFHSSVTQVPDIPTGEPPTPTPEPTPEPTPTPPPAELEWEMTSEGVLTINGSGYMANFTSSNDTSEWRIKEKNSITSVIIGEGITSIGDYAFQGYYNIASVTLPSTLTRIGNNAFYGCTKVKTLTIPQGVTSIGNSAFYNTGLTTLTIPQGTTAIGQAALSGCSSLTSVSLPDGMNSIPVSLLSGCTKLQAIDIPLGVTAIGNNAFNGCTGLEALNLPAGITEAGTDALKNVPPAAIRCAEESATACTLCRAGYSFREDTWQYNLQYVYANVNDTEPADIRILYADKDITALEVPACVTVIGEKAFYECTALAQVTLPGNVRLIENYAFNKCQALGTIAIPAKVQAIGDYAFYRCTGLTAATIPSGSQLTAIGRFAFGETGSMGAFELPGGITSVGEGAFSGSSAKPVCGLESLTAKSLGRAGYAFTIEAGMSSMYRYMYDSNGNETGIQLAELQVTNGMYGYTVPNWITCAASGVFRQDGLREVHLGTGFTSLQDELFMNCSNLQTIELPDTVTAIGAKAFYGCTGLTELELPDGIDSIGTYAFDRFNGTIYADPESTTAVTLSRRSQFFRARGNGYDMKYLFNAQDEPDGIQISNADKDITAVTIPAAVKSIYPNTFDGCTALAGVTFAEGSRLTSIGSYAFRNCTALQELTLPDGLQEISYSVFDGSNQLKVRAGAGTDAAAALIREGYAFWPTGEKYKVKYTWNSQTGTITNGFILSAEKDIVTLTVPAAVKEISEYALQNCTALTGVTLPEGLTTIGNGAFSNCSALSNLEIPATVTSIGHDAFSGCSSLAEIALPEGLAAVASNCFVDCTGLTKVTLPSTITNIELCAFSMCSNLAEINLPEGLQYIRNSAFQRCNALPGFTLPESIVNVEGAFDNCDAPRYAERNSHQAEVLGKAGYSFRPGDVDYDLYYHYNSTSQTTPTTINIGGVDRSKTSITITDEADGIWNNAFANSKLKFLRIPEGIGYINSGAFSGSADLEWVSIPVSVTYLRMDAFSNCEKLHDIYYAGTEEEWNAVQKSGAYSNLTSRVFFHYGRSGPEGMKIMKIPGGTTRIEDYAFSHVDAEYIYVPSGCKEIGHGAFGSNTGLKYVIIPDGITDLATDAFAGSPNVRVRTNSLYVRQLCIDNGIRWEWMSDY